MVNSTSSSISLINSRGCDPGPNPVLIYSSLTGLSSIIFSSFLIVDVNVLSGFVLLAIEDFILVFNQGAEDGIVKKMNVSVASYNIKTVPG